MNSLYIQETSYTQNGKYILHNGEYQSRQTLKMKKYILHFMFSYKYSTYQNSWIHVMKNYVNITYQVMGRQHITQNMIHDYSSRKIYSSIY